MLKPLDKVEFRKGEELLIKVIDIEDRRRILHKYRGALGKVSPEEIEELLAEVEWEWF